MRVVAILRIVGHIYPREPADYASMEEYWRRLGWVLLSGCFILGAAPRACAWEPWRVILPEQRCMEVRPPSRLPPVRVPETAPPRTVIDQQPDAEVAYLSLDDVLRIALANSTVIRVLGGSSGRTIYDPAIANTQIDQQRAAFDPALNVYNHFNRTETPSGAFDPADPSRVLIDGIGTNDYDMTMGMSKKTPTGATAGMNVRANPWRAATDDLALNPRTSSAVDLTLTQPLLKGRGPSANLAPIEIARIDTELSFYQLKDSVQEMVRGVIEAYWALVFARTDLWARRQQVKQGTEAFERAEANLRAGLGDLADVAQARSSLAGFRANLITAEAAVLRREATLRNILGMPPTVPPRMVPTTPPTKQWLDVQWNEIITMAAQQRPDLIQLKLLLESDRQQLLVAENNALPQVDATALYRWNGLEGRAPTGEEIRTAPGEFTGWQLGVNVSLPLGLRQSRAAMRQQELTLMRDRVNLDQGVHEALHLLAKNYRNLAQYYEEYKAYQDTRAASQINLDVQAQRYRSGFDTLYLNVLQAITGWGNSVSSEAQALTQYNTEMANLQRQMGTILEAHGIRFVEERYGSTGPAGRLFSPQCYPKDRRPCPNRPQYPSGDEPAENAFDLDDPLENVREKSGSRIHIRRPERIPPPVPQP